MRASSGVRPVRASTGVDGRVAECERHATQRDGQWACCECDRSVSRAPCERVSRVGIPRASAACGPFGMHAGSKMAEVARCAGREPPDYGVEGACFRRSTEDKEIEGGQ